MLLKKASVALYDGLSLLAPAMLLLVLMPTPAFAYVDPSVMTYTIQALAGVAVALSTVIGVAFRRTRKKLLKILNIDENVGKTPDPLWGRVEDGVCVTPTAQVDGAEGKKNRSSRRAGGADSTPKRKWPSRLLISALACVFTVFTLVVVAPLEIVAGSEGSLVFGLEAVWPVIAWGGVAIVVVSTLLVSALRGRAFDLVVSLVFSLGIACYVQAMFMNSGLPSATGATVNWSDYTTIAAISLAVWLVLFIAPLITSLKWSRVTQLAVGVLSAALIVVQGVGVASLFVSNDQASSTASSSYVMTREGMYDVSQKNNVIVFVLDTYDTQFLKDSYAAHPEMLNELTGFTWYQNSAGSMVPTRYGNVFLLTGGYPQEGETFQHFLAERYKRSNYLSDIESAGYSIGLYSDTLGAEYLSRDDAASLIYDKTINITTEGESLMDGWGTFTALMQCAVYRDFPWVAKPFFWFYTDQINQQMSVDAGAGSASPYTLDDARWFRELKSTGLTANDEGEAGAFRFIHMTGTHWPYNLDEHGEDIGLNNATLDQQAQGSMLMVSEYLRQLKELGLYDDATIVITADHGDYYPIQGPLEEPASPILLVKPSQSAEQAAQPLSISNAPVWAEDILATVIDAVGGDASAYGRTVYDIAEGETRRRIYFETTNDDKGYDVELLEYAINGDVLNMEDWTLTGRVIPVWD